MGWGLKEYVFLRVLISNSFYPSPEACKQVFPKWYIYPFSATLPKSSCGCQSIHLSATPSPSITNTKPNPDTLMKKKVTPENPKIQLDANLCELNFTNHWRYIPMGKDNQVLLDPHGSLFGEKKLFQQSTKLHASWRYQTSAISLKRSLCSSVGNCRDLINKREDLTCETDNHWQESCGWCSCVRKTN